jgi:putative transposase
MGGAGCQASWESSFLGDPIAKFLTGKRPRSGATKQKQAAGSQRERRKQMKGTRHSEEQIIAILKQGEAGLATADLCRQHGISEQTYYRWKAKYGGMETGDAKKLKQLEDENRKLKHVVADLTLDNRALKDVLSKNW